MRRITLACIGLSLTIFAGCSHLSNRSAAQSPPARLQHFYDYQLIRSSDQKPISLSQLIQDLADRDVVFMGELHSHSASHYLQIELLTMLYQHNPNLVLSMEQFERDKQDIVDQYLSNQIGEQTLIKEGRAWPNYASDYRPLVEFAKSHDIPVIAANAPKTLVRCIAQKGPDIVNQLPQPQRAYLADDLTHSSEAYQAKFRQFMVGAHAVHGQPKPKPEGDRSPGGHGSHGHGHGAKSGKLSNSFYAQLARDNTMAESIANALNAHPNHHVMAINGAFHSDGGLGTVDALKRLKPDVKIAVLSPYEREAAAADLSDAAKQGDYIYTIQTLPKRYVKKEHRDRAVMAMMKKRAAHQCAW